MHTASLYLIIANIYVHTHVDMHVHVRANAPIILQCCSSILIYTVHACLLDSYFIYTHTHLHCLIAARAIIFSLPSFTVRLSCSYRFTLLFSLHSPSSTIFVLFLLFGIVVSHLSYSLPPPPPSSLQSFERPHLWMGFLLSNNLELIFRSSLQSSTRGHSVFSLPCFTPCHCTFPSPCPHLLLPLLFCQPHLLSSLFFYALFLSPFLKTSENKRWSAHTSLCTCPQIPCCGCVTRMLPHS